MRKIFSTITIITILIAPLSFSSSAIGNGVHLSKSGTYQTITKRDWALIAKNPAKHKGKKISVFVHIFQFDSLTGENQFLGNVDVQNNLSSGYWSGGTTSLLVGTSSKLADYVEGDVVRISAVVLGTYSYPTKIGGTNRVPKLQVNAIKYLDSTK
jgi:hypothetical protein